MKNRLCAFALIVLTATANASEVISDAFRSAVLGRDIKLTVYLPDGYQNAATTYPVTYLLHGAGGNEREWADNGGIAATMDGLIRRGLVRPAIVVMPTMGGASWWVDGAADKAQTAFMRELLPFVEQKYRVAAGRGARSIGGLSMGGYGALHLTLAHPERFCAAAILSPAIYDPLPPAASAARLSGQFARNGQFDPEAWRALNYPSLLDAYRRATSKVPMWIASGDHDHLGIALESARLYWSLYQVQPKQVELRIVDGDHEWMTFRDTLPDALRYIDAQCAREPTERP